LRRTWALSGEDTAAPSRYSSAKEVLMELTDEGRKVLEIVRRVLVARTHWATWGQTLMAEIEAEVKKV